MHEEVNEDEGANVFEVVGAADGFIDDQADEE